jgi:PAS domain S-box-containing protein
MKCKLFLQMLNFCFIILFASTTQANNVGNFILDNQTVPSSLGANMMFLEDATHTISFEEILTTENWSPSPEIGVTKGFTKSAIWLRFTTENKLNIEFNWNLEFTYPLLDVIEFYTPNIDGGYTKKLMGDHLPFSDREIQYRNIVIPIQSNALQTNTYYVRITTTSSMNAILKAWPNNSFYKEVDSTKFILGLLYGVVLLAFFTSLVNSFYLKDLMYLWLSLAFFGVSLYLSGVKGITFQYLWPNAKWWSEVNIPFFVNLGYAPILQYTRLFLSLKEIAPKLDRLFVIFIGFGVLGVICSLLLSYEIMISLCTISASIMSILCILAGCYAWYKGNTSARLYVFSWIIWFIGSLTFAFTANGVFPRTFLTEWSQEVGFFFFVTLMTVAQFDRFLQTRNSHEKEQRSALNALSKAEEEYRSLFENAMEGIFKLNDQGVLNNANKTFLDITNVKDIGFIKQGNHPPFSLCFLDVNETDRLKLMLSEEASISDFISNFKGKDGEVKWVSLSVQKIEDNVDKTVTYRGALADITETKKREYAEKQRHMAEASTQAKDQFLANMSKEIRSPVSNIIDFTNQVSEINTDTKIDAFLLKIKRYSANLLGTINDILDFSEMEAGKLVINYAPFSIRQLLDNISHVVGDKVDEKGLALHIDVDEDIPEILIGDSARLNQILTNLANNAVKFSDEGDILISLELVALNKKAGGITLTGSVTDSGKGISAQDQSFIFDTQTNPNQDSKTHSGFGLSITKQLLELMDGSISVSSLEGKGSVFTFQFTCRIESRNQSRLEPSSNKPVGIPAQIEPVSIQKPLINNVLEIVSDGEHVNIIESHTAIENKLNTESEPEPEPESEITLDQEDGLERCQGNQKLYLKLFSEFIKNYSDTADKMSALLESNDLIQISKLAHTIKGLSANLGAKKLSKLAVSLEKLTALNEQEQNIALQLFATELGLVAKEMTIELDNSSDEFIEKPIDQSKFLEHELKQKLATLSAMINEQKMDAFEEAISLSARWPITEHITLLNEAADFLDLFDFENAAKNIEALSTKLEIGNL